MEYIHIRSLEKYHPGYKDRTLQWGKIYFRMVQGDPDCELITDEIDWGRLIKMILLELEAQKPLPNLERYWISKGFDLKKRPMSLTLQAIHNFIEINTDEKQSPYIDKSKIRIREDKEKNEINNIPPTIEEVKSYCKERNKGVDPIKWFNFYQAKGWFIGKTKMKDWRAAVRTWEQKTEEYKPQGKSSLKVRVLSMRAGKFSDQDIKQTLSHEGYPETEIDEALGKDY